MAAALPYALSVHHFVSQVGDYVGFAAIVAVAIMVLLLFAHARETAELRRRADYAEDELSLLHEQVEWLRDAQQPDVSAGAVMPGSGTGDVGVAAAAPACVRGGRSRWPQPGRSRRRCRRRRARDRSRDRGGHQHGYRRCSRPRSRPPRPLRGDARSCSVRPSASVPRR